MDTILSFLMFGGMVLFLVYQKLKIFFEKEEEKDDDDFDFPIRM